MRSEYVILTEEGSPEVRSYYVWNRILRNMFGPYKTKQEAERVIARFRPDERFEGLHYYA